MKWTCQSCGECHEDQFDSCWSCGCVRNDHIQLGIANSNNSDPEVVCDKNVVCSTTPFIPGRKIAGIKGIVCGEAVMDANLLRDFVAGITDRIDGRSGVYETKLREVRSIALQKMKREAEDLGAQAIVGVTIDHETVGGTMLMITASGTAVILASAMDEHAASKDRYDNTPV